MAGNFKNLERDFFRALNNVVEPAVRRGIGSSRFAPAGLIVLETTGFKTGQQRRTPLMALRVGAYTLVGTFRGQRSFWTRNIEKQPNITYYQGGRSYSSTALVMQSGDEEEVFAVLPRYVRRLRQLLQPQIRLGWKFVLFPSA